jgi:hypothetical protein
MRVFICHSRHDDVVPLVESLRRAGATVLMDQRYQGDQAWWSRVLDEIRTCEVFAVALSDQCLQSKLCQAQVDYARALELPMLPVQIAHMTIYRIKTVFTGQIVDFKRQLVDFRHPDVASGMAVKEALDTLVGHRTALPHPLPEPPPIPFEHSSRLAALTARIESPEQLSPAEQTSLVLELRSALEDEEGDAVRGDIRRVLRMLRARPELSHVAATQADQLLWTPTYALTLPPPSRPGPFAPSAPSAPPTGYPSADTPKERWWRRRR